MQKIYWRKNSENTLTSAAAQLETCLALQKYTWNTNTKTQRKQKDTLEKNSESKLTSAELFMIIGDLLGFTKIHKKCNNKYTKKYKKT